MNKKYMAAVLAVFCPTVLASCQAATIMAGRGINRVLDAEPRANTSAPQTVDRPAFRFQFPGDVSPIASTWEMDTGEKDYDPDHNFFIETVKRRGFIAFSIAEEEKDAKSLLEALVTHNTEFVAGKTREEHWDVRRTAFSTWGRYHGEGAVLSGQYHDSWRGWTWLTLRIFVFLAARRTYTVVEFLPDNDREAAGPGFRLIETTFQVKGADSSTQEERTHQRQAEQFYASGRWGEAAEEFEKAFAVRKDPAFLFNMALCYRRTRDTKRALGLYENYLSKVPDSPRRADIEGRIKVLRQELADADRADKPPAQGPAPESPVPAKPPVTPDGKQVE